MYRENGRSQIAAALLAATLMVLPLSVVAAEEPSPSTGAAAAPPPPAMVDEKTADKAASNSAANAAAKPQTNPQANPAQGDPELEPQVTLIEREDETREEVRVNGVIRYIKVMPKVGTVYYLLPVNGVAGVYVRRDSLDSGLRAPMWQILSW